MGEKKMESNNDRKSQTLIKYIETGFFSNGGHTFDKEIEIRKSDISRNHQTVFLFKTKTLIPSPKNLQYVQKFWSGSQIWSLLRFLSEISGQKIDVTKLPH